MRERMNSAARGLVAPGGAGSPGGLVLLLNAFERGEAW